MTSSCSRAHGAADHRLGSAIEGQRAAAGEARQRHCTLYTLLAQRVVSPCRRATSVNLSKVLLMHVLMTYRMSAHVADVVACGILRSISKSDISGRIPTLVFRGRVHCRSRYTEGKNLPEDAEENMLTTCQMEIHCLARAQTRVSALLGGPSRKVAHFMYLR